MFAFAKSVFAAAAALAVPALAAVPQPAAAAAAAPLTADVRTVAAAPLYVWAYTLADLHAAVSIARGDGFRPVGSPQFRYVPEAGTRAWMIYIVPAGY